VGWVNPYTVFLHLGKSSHHRDCWHKISWGHGPCTLGLKVYHLKTSPEPDILFGSCAAMSPQVVTEDLPLWEVHKVNHF